MICGKCKQEKQTNEFYTSKTRKSGYMLYCKECIKEYRRENHKKKKSEKRVNGNQPLDNISEIRDFITWARGEQIQYLKVGDLEFSFSDRAHRPQFIPQKKTANQLKLEQEIAKREEEELLTWST